MKKLLPSTVILFSALLSLSVFAESGSPLCLKTDLVSYLQDGGEFYLAPESIVLLCAAAAFAASAVIVLILGKKTKNR